MQTSLDLSIVVLNWNTSDLLDGALESITSTAGDLVYEVVVIDNASSDGGFAQVSKKFKDDARFTFIERDTNIGWAAINILLERKGKYVVTVDPDAIVHPGGLKALFAFMEATPDAGAATASLLNTDGSPQIYFRRIMTPMACFFMTVFGRVIDKYFFGLAHFKRNRYYDLDISRVSEVEQPSWPTLIWRKEALGPYIVDEKIPFYFVDVEMSKRLYDRGYKIYLVPDAVTTHLKSTSFSKANTAWRTQEYNRSLRYFFKKYHPFHVFWLLPLVLVDTVIRSVLKALTGREPLR